MSLKKILLRDLDLNYKVMMMQVDTLTHHDSLKQLPFRGNCLNWVLGHIVESRNTIVALLGGVPFWTDIERARYTRDSNPITEEDDALDFERILADFTVAQRRILEKIESLSEEALNSEGPDGQSFAENLSFFIWHETYHVGQAEYLRQLSGTNDKVI